MRERVDPICPTPYLVGMNNPGKQKPRRTKSPIRARPLPQPGDSLAEEFHDRLYGKANYWLSIIALLIALAIHEWIVWCLDSPRRPLLFSILILIAIIYPIYKTCQHVKYARRLGKGMQGEKAVGQYLDNQLKARGYHVFHDICVAFDNGTRFNIDHVVIGSAGIYALETKTRYKPETGRAVIEFNGNAVRVDGGPWDEAPIRQARANATFIREVLVDMTGRQNINVRPVVLFPGWYIKGNSLKDELWVLEPKALPKLLAKWDDVLSGEDVAFYQSMLVKYIRAKNGA